MKNVDDQLKEILLSFADEVDEDLEKSLDRRSKEVKKKIQHDAPGKAGKYRKSWSIKKEKRKRIVYNKKYGSIVHLLENGHQLTSGGRTKAVPHVENNQKEVAQEFLNDCEEIVKKHSY